MMGQYSALMELVWSIVSTYLTEDEKPYVARQLVLAFGFKSDAFLNSELFLAARSKAGSDWT